MRRRLPLDLSKSRQVQKDPIGKGRRWGIALQIVPHDTAYRRAAKLCTAPLMPQRGWVAPASMLGHAIHDAYFAAATTSLGRVS
jgi:hypothetical protein